LSRKSSGDVTNWRILTERGVRWYAHSCMADINTDIAIDPAVKFGKPVVKGTRVPVDLIVRELGAGMTMDVLMREYRLTEQQVHAALRYAADVVAAEELVAP